MSLVTNNWIVLAVRWSVTYFLLQIPWYSRKIQKKKKKLVIPNRFALQANAITTEKKKFLVDYHD